jgi:hypothetical protein
MNSMLPLNWEDFRATKLITAVKARSLVIFVLLLCLKTAQQENNLPVLDPN